MSGVSKKQISEAYDRAVQRRFLEDEASLRAEIGRLRKQTQMQYEEIEGLKREMRTLQKHQGLTDLDMQVILDGIP